MLDDLKFIHQRDKSDALGICEKQYLQLEHIFDVPELGSHFEHVVYCGMGGSALAARMSKTWPGYSVPFEIVSEYHIPHYVSEKTLFIASSYSGNTEETVAALAEAEQANATIVVLASGGALEHIAREKDYPFVRIPDASQPRFAVLYSFKALVTVLSRAGFVKKSEAEQAIHEASAFLQSSIQDWLPAVPASKNLAKQIALEAVGTSPVIYAGPLLAPIAYKWKISFNENAKNVAWCNQFPELNHNEIEGWTSHPLEKPYRVINLASTFEDARILKRFELTDKYLSGKRPHPVRVEAHGTSVLEHLIWTMVLGDFTSLYTALLNNVDPTPVPVMERLKKELAANEG